MLYEYENYLDDNETRQFDGSISVGDYDRLRQIAEQYMPSFLFDINSVISFVIRTYYKEHNVSEFIKEKTGVEYKEYEEFLEKMRKKYSN